MTPAERRNSLIPWDSMKGDTMLRLGKHLAGHILISSFNGFDRLVSGVVGVLVEGDILWKTSLFLLLWARCMIRRRSTRWEWRASIQG